MNHPWTPAEIKIIEDTADLSVHEVVKLLPGRTLQAVHTKRHYLRHGRTIEGGRSTIPPTKRMSEEDKAALFVGRRYVDAGIRS